MLQESEIKGHEYQDDSDVHRQPFPKRVPEEEEIDGDDDGCQQHHIEYGRCLASHCSDLANRGVQSAEISLRSPQPPPADTAIHMPTPVTIDQIQRVAPNVRSNYRDAFQNGQPALD